MRNIKHPRTRKTTNPCRKLAQWILLAGLLWPCISSAGSKVPKDHERTLFEAHVAYRSTIDLEEPLLAELWVRRYKNGVAHTDHHPIVIPNTARSTRGRGGVLEYWFEAEGWWSPTYAILAEGGPQKLDWLIYPTGTLSGRVAVPPGQQSPKEIEARFEQTPNHRAEFPIPRGKVKCPVAEARFECDIPAGALDVRLKADGFISHYLWSLKIDRGLPENLGELLFSPGSSVVGRVEDGISGEGKEGARVRLVVDQAGNANSRADRERLDRLTLPARTGKGGFFQVKDVPPGQYRILAQATPAIRGEDGPVRVFEGKETALTRPLRVFPPARVAVRIHPARDPSNRAWKVHLRRLKESQGGIVPLRPGEEEALWEATGVSHGEYLVSVKDARGRTWASELMTVEGTGPVAEIDLEVLAIEGKVTLKGEPIEASITYGGRRGAVQLEFESDDTGFYTGLLPRAGTWRVDVESQDPSCDRRNLEVEVTEGRNGSPTTVDLELGSLGIGGRVVDRGGKGVPGFAFMMTSDGHPHQELTDSEGYFQYTCLEGGTYYLQGYIQGGSLASERIEVEISEDRGHEEIDLVLSQGHLLEGQVVSEWGAVAGAQILVRSGGQDSVKAPMILPKAQTGADGTFRLVIPTEVDEIALIVAAPGYGLKTVRQSLGEGTPVTIPVYSQAGTLVLDLAEGLESVSFTEHFRLELNGVYLGLRTLLAWRDIYGAAAPDESRIVVPMIEFGELTFCHRTEGQETCESKTLLPFGEVTFVAESKLSPLADRGTR